MSNYPNVAAEAGDQYLAMLAQGQDQFVEFVRSSREMMPQIPEMPKMPQFQGMPEGFAPQMPSPQEVADAQFGFVTKLLKQQEGFMRKLYNIPASSAAPKRAASKTGTTARRTKRKTKTSR